MEIVVNVLIVVAIYEPVPDRLGKDGQGYENQQAADGDRHAAAGSAARALRRLR